MAVKISTVTLTDDIYVSEERGNTHHDKKIPLDELKTIIENDANGIQTVRYDNVVDLTSLAAKFVNVVNVPVGAILDYVALYVETLVVASGTTVKLGLGDHSGTVNTYGNTTNLTVGQTFSVLVAPSLVAGSPLAIDLCGIVTAVNALGSGNITAGTVRVVVIYRQPATLAA